jgi:hypothetical protein
MKALARILAAAVTAAATWLAPVAARAADPPKRPTPDYDGRGKPPTTAGDVALWAPRIVVSPLYLVSEFVLRRPLSVAVPAAEKNNFAAALVDFFTFDSDHKVGLVPTAFVDFGLLPSVGLYFFWDDFVAKKNDLRLQGGTWGEDWLKATISDRLALSDKSGVAVRASWARRRDALFFGTGPRSRAEDESRYEIEVADASVHFDHTISGGVRLDSTVGLRDARFANAACCEDPTLGELAAAGRFTVPPGFDSGYTMGYQRVELALDSRAPRPSPQTGVRLALEAQPSVRTDPSPGRAWIRYGGTLGGFVDVTGHNRVLSLSFTTLFTDPITDGAIPFTEQVTLGGTRYMRGYLIGRLVDRSAAIATLQYQWPIWVWLDGTVQAAVGNVFGAGLRDFEPRLLRLSSGIGLRTTSSPDSAFEILVGFGTDTFADGAKVTSGRLAIGGTYGF